ncbi:MAG: TonB-dependent receptor [Pontixanthobacter sp.]
MTRPSLYSSCAILALGIAALPGTSMAQEEPPAAREGSDEPETDMTQTIIVRGTRLAGQVDTDLAPILELDEDQIAAYGANSIEDLVTALEPQTNSNRGRGGRPVFLVNGVRIGSFREFRSYPPEAIQKVEVLPEEVAQKFGFPPTRRVVNFILKDDYSAVTLEVEYEQPDRGGYSFNEQEATLLKITGGGRLNVNLEREDTSALTEAERNIRQTEDDVTRLPTDPDPAAFRTLIGDSVAYEASVNYAKAFLDSGSSVSINGTYERSESENLFGLDTVVLTDSTGSVLRTLNVQDPLRQRSESDTFSAAGSYSRPLGGYVLTLTADASYADTTNRIDQRADVSALIEDARTGLIDIRGDLPNVSRGDFATASSRIYSVDSKATLQGSPIFLPGGELQTTLDLGFTYNGIESEDTRADGVTDLSRSNLAAGINVTVPITSERENFLANAGTISINASAGLNEISDFGTLFDWSLGLQWEPADGLDLQMTYTRTEQEPSLTQLGAPRITTFNVPTFDFVDNTTRLVDFTRGGNPDLLAETQSDWSFSANWNLPFLENARANVNYSVNRSDNVSSSFPFLTPEIEAAFPDRITRRDGVLTAIDLRPVDFFETRSKRVSFGFNYNGRIGKAPEPAERGGGPREEGVAGAAGRPENTSRHESAEQPAGGPFAALREKVCADDGAAFLDRLVAAVENGETFDELPGFDPERAQRLLDRLRNEDGTIDPERLAQFRTGLCEGQGGASSGEGGTRRGGGRGGNPAASFFGGGGDDDRANFFLSMGHTVELDRQILIAPGGPRLDLLDGDSLTSTGTPQNTSFLEGGVFKGGLGLRLSGRYTGSARIDGSGLTGDSTDLFIGDLARFDIRVFADLGEVLEKDDGALKNLRISAKVDNVFDGRRTVIDSDGITPIGFQPFLIDPVGRFIGIDVRKLF